MPNVLSTDQGRVRIVEIDRPETRNAIDDQTAGEPADVFEGFDADNTIDIAVPTGAEGMFCSGADLGAVADGKLIGRMGEGDRSPLGPVRMLLSKPVIAGIIEQWSLTEEEPRRNETRLGLATAASGEPQRGATAFIEGKGRHSRPVTR